MPEKSTLRKVVDTVKDAAVSAVYAAEKHVVTPVGKAIGLVKKETNNSNRKALNKSKRKALAQAIAGRRKMNKLTLAAKQLAKSAKG